MKLEVQLTREMDARSERTGHALAWSNAGVDWDARVAPWKTVGAIAVTQVLPEEATAQLSFDPSQGAGFLDVPPSTSWRDHRSLLDTQVRVMRTTSRVRMALQRTFGLPRRRD